MLSFYQTRQEPGFLFEKKISQKIKTLEIRKIKRFYFVTEENSVLLILILL